MSNFSLMDRIERAGEDLAKYSRSGVGRRGFLGSMAAGGAVAIGLVEVAHAEDGFPGVSVYPSSEKPGVMIVDSLLDHGQGVVIGGQPYTTGSAFYRNTLVGEKCVPYALALFADKPHRILVEVRDQHVKFDRFNAEGMDFNQLVDQNGPIVKVLKEAVGTINSENEERTGQVIPATHIFGGLVTQANGAPDMYPVINAHYVDRKFNRVAEPPDCQPVVSRQEQIAIAQAAVSGCPITWEVPGILRASGVPSVGVGNLDVANPPTFRWTALRNGADLPSGMRVFWAEPGGLLVDPNNLTSAQRDEWIARIATSNGAIKFTDTQNQQVFQGSTFSGQIPREGYTLLHLEEGRLRFPTLDLCLSVDLIQRSGRNRFLVAIKGRRDRGDLTVEVDKAVGGNALYQRFDRAAFLSPVALNDVVANEVFKISDRATAVAIDLNTFGMMLADRVRGSTFWNWIVSNYTGV